MRPVRGVLFDFGHTLFDTASSVDFIVQWTTNHGRPLNVADASELWEAARAASRTPAELAKGRDRSAPLHAMCWLDLWADLDAECPGVAAALYDHETGPLGWSPYSDVLGVMAELAAMGVKMAVVSDVAFDLRVLCRYHGIDQFVDAYVLSYERGSIKPDGLLFAQACDELGVGMDEALMVGDNPANDGAGAPAGVRTLLLPMVPSGQPRGLDIVVHLARGT